MDDLRPIHVFIVFLVALLTGLILGISAWVLAGLLEVERAWIYGAGVLVLTISITWVVLIKRSVRMIEAVLDVDIDRDGYIGDPPTRILLMDETDKGRSEGWILHDLPGGEYRFARLSTGVLNGTPLAERYWTGSAGPYSLKQFRELRDYLLLRGFLSWASEQDHRQGINIEAPGRALIRNYAQMVDHSLPIQVDNWPE